LALCASPTCRAAFFDTSQSRTRKWCDMNTCGNRQKKARFNANQRKNGIVARTGVSRHS
jgi:predicted RNA-binding Zn ribbon-like protein